jgi:hypothetical protein
LFFFNFNVFILRAIRQNKYSPYIKLLLSKAAIFYAIRTAVELQKYVFPALDCSLPFKLEHINYEIKQTILTFFIQYSIALEYENWPTFLQIS